jgi:DNA processing protein
LSEGINQFHPKGELFTQENILVISQFEPDAHWATHFAMTRNKLVCALSRAVVVIVSGPERAVDGKMSGTFNAGVTALEMEIPVFVVAPSYFDDKPEGNHQLITKGCREWNPLDGAAPIITAILSENASVKKNSIAKTKKAKTKQLELFDNEDSPNNRLHITLGHGRAKRR